MFACEQFHYYICGPSIVVETDHKPVIGLLSNEFHKVLPRLQRLLLRLQRYSVKLVYIPGKHLTAAGALYRAPDPAETIKTSDQEYQVLACTLVLASTPKLAEIRKCRAADRTFQCVASYIQKGWPDKISSFHPSDGFLCYSKLLVPAACQKELLSRLHRTHRGIISCKNTARQCLLAYNKPRH